MRRRVEVTNPKESRPVNTNGLKLFVGPPSQNIAQSVPLTANLKDYITGMTVLRRGNARADNSESMTRCIAQLMTKKKTALGWSNPDGQCDWETAHQCVVMDAGEYVIHKNPTPEEKATYDSLFVEIEGRSSVEDSPRYSGQQTQGGAGASRSSEFERLTPRAESRGGGYYDGTRDVPMPVSTGHFALVIC